MTNSETEIQFRVRFKELPKIFLTPNVGFVPKFEVAFNKGAQFQPYQTLTYFLLKWLLSTLDTNPTHLHIILGADETNLRNQSTGSLVGDHFLYSHDLNVSFRDDKAGRNLM